MNWSPDSVERFALPDFSLTLTPEALLQEAARREHDVQDEAYTRGYEDGQQAGRSALEAQVLPALEALGGAADSLQAVQAALSAEAEEALLAMAIAVAREIVQRELQQDPEQLRTLIRRATTILPMEQTLEIRLHPHDLATLAGDLEMHSVGGRRLEVLWVPDDTLDRGGYVIETPQRIVDANLDEQLLAYYRRLRDG